MLSFFYGEIISDKSDLNAVRQITRTYGAFPSCFLRQRNELTERLVFWWRFTPTAKLFDGAKRIKNASNKNIMLNNGK